MTTNWLKDCEICSAGLCAEVEAKKEQGVNERTLENQILKEASNIRKKRKADILEAKKAEPKEIDNFERIRKSVRYSIEGLTAWADKRMKPETEDEAASAKAILGSAANMIIQYARLGVDVEGILHTFLRGNDYKENEDDKFNRAKQVN